MAEGEGIMEGIMEDGIMEDGVEKVVGAAKILGNPIAESVSQFKINSSHCIDSI